MKTIEITIQNQLFQVKAEEWEGRIWLHWNGKIFVLNRTELKSTEISDHPTSKDTKYPDKHIVLSPMPGQIVKILVHPGQEVKENQTVLVLSSMKMEYTLKAPNKGFIKSVKVKEGERVSADQALVEITKFLEKT